MKCRELRTNTLNSENPNQQFECQHIKYAVEILHRYSFDKGHVCDTAYDMVVTADQYYNRRTCASLQRNNIMLTLQ